MGALAGKVALITGGARGMGASHVRAFIAEGADVYFGDVLDAEGEALAAELGDRAHYRHHDVTDPASWELMVAAINEQHDGFDILVNNAGVLAFQSIADSTLEDFKRVIDINLIGQWIGIKHSAPSLRRNGSVVNIASVNSMVGGSHLSAYSASKAGVAGLTKAAAVELAPNGIRVNSVHPGGVSTPMVGDPGTDTAKAGPMASVPAGRFAAPEELSAMVVFLASDAASYCTGAEFLVDGGMLANRF